ncbi:MAG TPA: S8 family serine peptidase, partial [Afifellaceae bacterium]|nr:S8 family serine peptidase [Afifellaceae bacterium]
MKSFAGAIGLSMVLIGAAAGPGSTAPFEDRPGAGPSVPPGAAVSQAARGDANDDGIEDGLSAQIAAGPPNALFDVIVVFDGPDAVGRSRAAAGPFAVTQEFSVINGCQATLTAAQIRGLSRAPGLFRISGVSTVKLQDITSNNDFGATNARTDFLLDGSGVTICVVDTGINAAHEQFDTKGPGSVPLGPLEFLDAVNGLANPYDDHGHGTHVAGSAAGDGTGSSIYAADGIGAAPGASIVAAKVLSASGEGSDAQV